MTPDDELLQRLDRESLQSAERLRALLRAEGREDLIPEFDQRLKDIRTGVDGARGTWHALSGKQRYTLTAMADGRYIARSLMNPRVFHGYRNGTQALSGQPGVMLAICRIGTARALSARELIHVDGGATDPEGKFVITEKGVFVFKHGQGERWPKVAA
jgi:hypothetical protein